MKSKSLQHTHSTQLKHKTHNIIILSPESDLKNVLLTPSRTNGTIF